jgi:hypothetical protein
MSLAATRRKKAFREAGDPKWRKYALDAGVSQVLINLRRAVCGLSTTEFKFVTGMAAGERGDVTQFGDAVIKVMGKLQRGRRMGQKDVFPRARKRSKAEKMASKKAGAGHRVVQPIDGEELGCEELGVEEFVSPSVMMKRLQGDASCDASCDASSSGDASSSSVVRVPDSGNTEFSEDMLTMSYFLSEMGSGSSSPTYADNDTQCLFPILS